MFLSVGFEQIHFMTLKAVSESSKPIGAWKLRRLLQYKNFDISKATAGRLLRLLEDKGYVRSEGNIGRVITPEGQVVLKEWAEARIRKQSHTAFEESLTIRGRKHLLDALIARKAIESETAYLAAENASEEDINKLRNIIKKHEKLLNAGVSGAGKDVEFHRTLARASKNKVLLSALDVIHYNPQVSRVLESIRSKMGSKMVEGHKRILVQVVRKNKKGARAAMVQHIDGVIEDVDKYWAEID